MVLDLESTIKHAEEVAEQNEWFEENYLENKKCKECAKEHKQLAEWLKELKQYKEKNTPVDVIYSGDGYADGYMVYDFANCPNCDYEFEDGDDNWNAPYCCRCGQRLKWEEEE